MDLHARAQEFEDFYERHYPAVLQYARRRVEEEAARDVAAEVFMTAWRHFDVACERGQAWLYRVAFNVIGNHWRSQARQARLRDEVGFRVDAVTEDASALIAERDRVARALACLSAIDQELLRLTVWEGLGAAAAAEVVGCSAGSAYVRLHRARKRLVRLLDDGGRERGLPVRDDFGLREAAPE
ncbi:MAG: RNA polymerase sigma factor [Dermatophilus congolensis]|nr:RNA polymerase sigma factor [Dermatophilus congolensis]